MSQGRARRQQRVPENLVITSCSVSRTKILTYVFLTFPLALATREDRARETAFTPPSFFCTATLQLAAADFTSPFSQPQVTQSNPASPASTAGLPHPPLAIKTIILVIDYLI